MNAQYNDDLYDINDDLDTYNEPSFTHDSRMQEDELMCHGMLDTFSISTLSD